MSCPSPSTAANFKSLHGFPSKTVDRKHGRILTFETLTFRNINNQSTGTENDIGNDKKRTSDTVPSDTTKSNVSSSELCFSHHLTKASERLLREATANTSTTLRRSKHLHRPSSTSGGTTPLSLSSSNDRLYFSGLAVVGREKELEELQHLHTMALNGFKKRWS